VLLFHYLRAAGVPQDSVPVVADQVLFAAQYLILLCLAILDRIGRGAGSQAAATISATSSGEGIGGWKLEVGRG